MSTFLYTPPSPPFPLPSSPSPEYKLCSLRAEFISRGETPHCENHYNISAANHAAYLFTVKKLHIGHLRIPGSREVCLVIGIVRSLAAAIAQVI